MVTVDVFGGIGNQMFQYALGRHLSIRLNTRLKFNYSINLTRTDFNPKDIPSIFDIFDLAGKVENFKVPSNQLIGTVWAMKKALNRFQRRVCINESDFRFDKSILETPNNCFLSGYWQSEKYFKDNSDLIRQDFQIRKPMNANNLRIANKIANTNSVSLHLRGRDYITNEVTKKILLTCDLPYYERCISFFRQELGNPHFFVFSDDPEWAKNFLKIDDSFTFVEGNAWNETNYDDMRLMSLCKHNIIANSSFSWWGAWLNNNNEKKVIAPKLWFADPERNKLTIDLVPEEWMRL